MKAQVLFKALADDTRLRLFHVLSHFELNVNEIVEILNMGQSRISHHLKILTDSSLLASRKNGLWTFYTVEKRGSGHRFYQAIRYLFENSPVLDNDLARARSVVDGRSRESQRFFDAVAADWGNLKREIMGEFDLNAMIIKEMDGNKGGAVADLGCGNGDLLPLLRTKYDKVIGVDRSAKMLNRASQNLPPSAAMSTVELRIGDLEHLPLREGEVDMAVINMVLHHLDSPINALREVNRILTNRGQLLLADFVSHTDEDLRNRFADRWLGFSQAEISEWLGNIGFSGCRFKHFDLQKGLKGFMLSAKKDNKNDDINYSKKGV